MLTPVHQNWLTDLPDEPLQPPSQYSVSPIPFQLPPLDVEPPPIHGIVINYMNDMNSFENAFSDPCPALYDRLDALADLIFAGGDTLQIQEAFAYIRMTYIDPIASERRRARISQALDTFCESFHRLYAWYQPLESILQQQVTLYYYGDI
jgi:hypothetical protein